MTLEEAISILINRDCPNEDSLFKGYALAVKLGIEALKFRQRWEQQEGDNDYARLQAETNE
jgi:hypothetical protein